MRTRRITLIWLRAISSLLLLCGPTLLEAGVNEWTSNGPFGGNISCLAIDPVTPTTIYAGINQLYKSVNGGASWAIINNGLQPNVEVDALAIDPLTPATIYAIAGGRIFKSIDAGASLTAISTGVAANSAEVLAIDPVSTATIYAGFRGNGIYKSIDAGTSWAAINTGLTSIYVSALAVDPATPATIYAGTASGVFKSIDAGTSWAAINTGLTSTSVISLAIDPGSPATIYAGTYGGGVFKSIGGGASWMAINTGLTNTYIHVLAIDPATPAIIYAGTYGGVFKSTNAGTSWVAITTGLIASRVHALAVDPTIPATIYAGTYGYGGGVFKSIDAGASWAAINSGLRGNAAYDLAIDQVSPATIYAGTASGVFKSIDAGTSWAAINTGLTSTSVISLAIDPGSPATIYAGTYGGGVFKSIGGGASWVAINTGLTNTSIHDLAIDPVSPATIYAGTDSGVFKSIDAGTSWAAINTGLTSTSVFSLAIDPGSPATIYAGTYDGGVFKSIGGGASWMAINTGLTNTFIHVLAIDPVSPATIYAGTDSGVFKSIDAGTSWAAINTGLMGNATYALAIDPSSPATIYAGTTVWDAGVFKSDDGGGLWSAINTGIMSSLVYVYVLAIDPNTPSNLYAGIQGQRSGVFNSVQVPPSVTAVLPNETCGLTDVTILGTLFTGASEVTFGATSATSFSVVSETQINAITPAHEDGIVDVKVTVFGNDSPSSLENQFVCHAIPAPVIIGPSGICEGMQAILSTQAAASYQWIKDGSDISGATNSTYLAMASGSYAVTVVDSNGCAGTSAAKAVTIRSLPTPSVTGASTGCTSPGAVMSTQTYSAYQWRRDGSTVSGATSSTYTATSSGSYSVRVTDSYGCIGTSPDFYVAIFSNPTPAVSGNSTGCLTPGVILSTQSFSTCQWKLSGSNISGATLSTYTAIQSGNYAVAVVDSNGCAGTSANFAVTLSANPTPTVTGDSDGCEGAPVILSTGAFSAYQWTKDGTDIPGATSQNYSAISTGSFSVKVTDSNGCIGISPTKVVTFHALPNPEVTGADTGCESPGVDLSTQYSESYQWIKNGTIIPGSTDCIYTVTSSGDYSVTVTDWWGCSNTSMNYWVNILSSPTPTVSGAASGCADAGVPLTTGAYTAYQWRKDGCDISGATLQGYTATQSGTYRVRGTDSNGCTGTSDGWAVTINSNPMEEIMLAEDFESWPPSGGGSWSFSPTPTPCNSADFAWDYTGCTTYANQTGGAGFAADANSDWWYNIGVPATADMTTPSFSLTGIANGVLEYDTFFVKLSDNDYSDVDITTNGGLSWTNLEHFQGANIGPVHRTVPLADYQGQSSVQIRFRYYADNWNWYWQVDNITVLKPAHAITGSSTGCSDPGVVLSALPFVAYQWQKGGADIAGATSQNFSATESGLYAVRVTDSNGCVGTSAGHSLTIHTNPTPTVMGSSSGCQSLGVTLNTGTYTGYQWRKDGSDISGATNQSFTATQDGTYSVRVTDSNGCIGTSAGHAVTLWVNPAPAITGNSSGCQNPGIALNTGAFSSYLWQLDGSDISGATAQNYTATASGTYTVRVTDGNGCVGNSAGKTVTVYSNPTPTISGPTPACVSGTLSTGSFATYAWYRNGSQISGASGQIYSAVVPGSYTVKVTSPEGCSGTSSAFVISSNPAPVISGPSTGCTSVVLTTTPFSSYQWQVGGTDIPGATFQTYTAYADGSYQVRVTNSAGCIGTSASKAVTITTFIPATYGDNINTCPATTVSLSADAFSVYQWFYNGVPINGATSQTYEASVSGNYSVRSTDGTGCEGTSVDHAVFIDYCPFVSEVSPKQGIFKARLVKSAESSTGYFLFFQRLDSVNGYNIYEGNLGTFYSHASAPGNLCSATVLDLGSGEMRAEITPSTGNHYYLVTAFGEGSEGPSGFRSNGVEIESEQSTCMP